MTYYKVLNENGFIGVGTTENLVKYQKKHSLTIGASEVEAEGILLHDYVYHDAWMLPLTECEYEHSEATVLAVTKEEFDALQESIDKGEEIEVEQPIEETDAEETEEIAQTEEEEITAEFVRDVKLKELSLACNKAITSGFDIELSDGEQHHFSMSLQDQANLNAASMQILNGDSEIAYHADGEQYKMFSSKDMIAVVSAANQHKLKHLTYYGCLKAWLNGLVRISNIQAVTYGSDIPVKYQSPLYRALERE